MTNTIEAAAGYGNWNEGDLYPVLFTGHVIHELQKASVAEQITNTLFEGDITGGGSSVKIIKAPTLTVERNKGRGAKTNPQYLDVDALTLTVDQTAELSFVVDDISQALSNIDLMNMTVKQAVYEMSDSFDVDILGFAETSATSFTSGTIGFGASDLDPINIFAQAREQLGLVNSPYEGCWAVISPTYEKFLMAVDSKLLNANEMGKGPSPLITPARPKYIINGIEVYVSNNLPTKSTSAEVVLFGHKDAISTARAFTKSETQRLVLEGFGDVYKSLMVWGRLAVRPSLLFKTTATYGTLG